MAKSTQSRNLGRLRKTAIKSAIALRKGQESAEASLQVIRKRMELGIAAQVNPATADHAEFSRMVPEKVSALLSTSMIFSEKSAQLCYQMWRHVTQEMTRATRHTQAMMAMTDPAAAITAQTSYIVEAAERMFNVTLFLSSAGATLIEASGSPSHRTVMANARRLG
ncbi:MAG TPA: hypothetical protein VND94_15510 [Terriglobia bacterium]|nr:hypothetical protein [Terriglobia bacterium]